MRRSRGLTFKREQEQKLNSLLNKGEGRSSNVPEVEAPSKKPLALPAPVRPDARSMREAIKDIRQTKKTPAKKVIESDEEEEEKYVRNNRKNTRPSREEDYEERHKDHDQHEEHEDHRDHDEEEHEDDHDYHEEEEEVKPVAKGRAMKPNNHKDEIKHKQERQEKQEAKPSARGRKPKVQEEEEHEQSERTERTERPDREDREEDDDKKRKMIIPKSFFQKMISTANIDTTSSDIYPTLQAEMIDYIVEVIKIVSNNEEDEVVVKDSNLRFLGEKGKAIGNLDVKLFEKIYGEAQKILVHNVTFTSESFKSLCKYTEIHIMEFLKKARAIMIHAGRKRLTLADIELLKFILE